MNYSEFASAAELVGQVAREAIDEPDAIARHPEVVEVVAGLAGMPGLNDLFGGNGHDPDAFVTALAEGLQPYKELPLEDPQVVEDVCHLAAALHPALVPDSQAAHA
jgi:hypothetical protein